MESYTFEAGELTLPEIKSKLASLEGFSIISQSDHSFEARLGSSVKYRLLGSFLWNNYLPPMKVVVNQNDRVSQVSLAHPNGYLFYIKGKNERFYRDAFTKVKEHLKG